MSAKNERYLINSVLRAAQILESFSMDKPAYTNAEFSKRLNLNRSTVTRLLYSLEEAGLLERKANSGHYVLTHKLFQIGSVYINLTSLPKEARPHLSQLVSRCNETAHLGLLDGFEVLYIEKVECTRPVRMMSFIGGRLPAYCTGIGKIFLAHLDEEALRTFFQTIELKPFTPRTITDASELRRHLARIRDQGYAIDNAEREPEVKSIAAPVRDKTGKVVAGISLAGPAYRMTEERIAGEFIPAVRKTAKDISERLGYMGPMP